MPGTPYRVDVRPKVPQRLARLEELACNLWYAWHRPARALFARLNPSLWLELGHRPRALLRSVDQARLDEAARDPAYLAAYDAVLAAYDAYHAPSAEQPLAPGELVAYFCAEFGLHESLPIYSGGLGILAGDHCKTASDLRVPFAAVGLLYRQGYFQQTIDGDGRQHAHYADAEFDQLPIEPATLGDGRELRIALGLPGRRLLARVWRARVGRVPLYLLDTDLEDNAPADRAITRQLYVGNLATRLEQEIVLGVGGVRALAELGHQPTCWHLNEGHPAFAALERARALVARGAGLDAALEAVAAGTVFTTHTPVPAGHDQFAEDAVRAHLEAALPELKPHLAALAALGRSAQSRDFNMTTLAVRLSRGQNGVSRIHGRVAAEMCAELWPQVEPAENPMGAITNGVHVPTFLSDAWRGTFDQYLGADWLAHQCDPARWDGARRIPDAQFWAIHQSLKSELLHLVRHRLARQYARSDGSQAHLDRLLRHADPERPDVLTIGFARRFATYKRANLLFSRIDWLRELATDAKRPLLFLFAGKAHPADQPGQELIRRIAEVARLPEFEASFLLLEDYDLHLARRLVCGVDVWLNNPVYPMEACGTSGMKAALNGVINLSVLDGWWDEGYDGRNGWAIRPSRAPEPARRDAEEARTLFELLQDQVIPLYYGRTEAGFAPAWVAKAKESMASIAPRFSSVRMLEEYLAAMYRPACQAGRRMAADDLKGARALAAWKAKVRSAWSGVTLRRLDQPAQRLEHGERIHVAVAARLNGLAAGDVVVEAVFARQGVRDGVEHRALQPVPGHERGEQHYALEFPAEQCGRLEYRVRAWPRHELLSQPFEMGMMTWL